MGLVVPGVGNSIPVANGQAHGRGIYTATLNNAMLSWGFSRGAERPMLVCGVLDDAEILNETHNIGMLQVTAESSSVRHVGNAMVVLNPERVAPLYIVTHKGVGYSSGRLSDKLQRWYPQERQPRKRIQKPRICVSLTGAVAFLSRRAARKHRDR